MAVSIIFFKAVLFSSSNEFFALLAEGMISVILGLKFEARIVSEEKTKKARSRVIWAPISNTRESSSNSLAMTG